MGNSFEIYKIIQTKYRIIKNNMQGCMFKSMLYKSIRFMFELQRLVPDFPSYALLNHMKASVPTLQSVYQKPCLCQLY